MGKMTRISADTPPLDRWRLDEILTGSKPEKLWGAQAIADALGVSDRTVRRWAVDPAVPIYQPKGTGTFFALRSELRDWLRNKST